MCSSVGESGPKKKIDDKIHIYKSNYITQNYMVYGLNSKTAVKEQ